jgi:hypothetical protein
MYEIVCYEKPSLLMDFRGGPVRGVDSKDSL